MIGGNKVVFLDEPSGGLDPASRRLLWDAILEAKRTKAIVLTTHSMEEAEVSREGAAASGSRPVGTRPAVPSCHRRFATGLASLSAGGSSASAPHSS